MRLDRLGYTVCGANYNTANYWLPQQRQRAWLLCFRKDQIDEGVGEARIKQDMSRFEMSPIPLSRIISLQELKLKDGKAVKKSCKEKPGGRWQEAWKEECERWGKARNVLHLLAPLGLSDLQVLWQAKLVKLVKKLTPLAHGCSKREVAILASAIEELRVEKSHDAMTALFVIQVVPWIQLPNHAQASDVINSTFTVASGILTEDQNFGRSTYPKSNIYTSSCVIAGGKYIVTGPGKFRTLRAKESGCVFGCLP